MKAVYLYTFWVTVVYWALLFTIQSNRQPHWRQVRSYFLLALGPFRSVPTDTEQIKLQRQQAEDGFKNNPQLCDMQTEI